MIKAMFAQYDVVCDTCVNAGELIELIRHKRYDLLITDLRMPGHNGYDILELLRTSNVNNSKKIPVIVATASGSCTKEELLEKGFSDCIFKPFSKQDLLGIADRNIAYKEESDDAPDFTSVLAYGDELEMLDKIISVTEQDMQNFKDAAERKDLKEIDEFIHHLRSSWVILNMDKPLWELHELLKDTTLYGEEELQDAMNTVLEAGEAIIRCANEKKKEVVNG
jgi:CheY-like chemotaxis protein